MGDSNKKDLFNINRLGFFWFVIFWLGWAGDVCGGCLFVFPVCGLSVCIVCVSFYN